MPKKKSWQWSEKNQTDKETPSRQWKPKLSIEWTPANKPSSCLFCSQQAWSYWRTNRPASGLAERRRFDWRLACWDYDLFKLNWKLFLSMKKATPFRKWLLRVWMSLYLFCDCCLLHRIHLFDTRTLFHAFKIGSGFSLGAEVCHLTSLIGA